MKRTKTKILSVFLSFCMIISCMVGISLTASATSTTTVVWESTEFEEENTKITSHEGISLTGGYVQYEPGFEEDENGERKLYTGNNTNTSFSTTLGVFTEITVTGGWHYSGKAFFTGEGWSNATWSGDPASTVPFNLYTMMTDDYGNQPWSITFTIAPATTYTVTYDGNGATSGTVPTDTNTYAENASVTLAGNTGNLAKTDCTFLGWNTSPTATTALTSYTMGTSNVTFYAIWAEESSTTVDVTGVILNPSTATLTVGGDAVALTATVAPEGATDKTVKWSVGGTNASAVTLYSDSNCTAGNEIGTDATETLTVYAKGISAGNATVTATSNADSTKIATCAVTVNAASAATLTYLEGKYNTSTGKVDYTEKTATGANKIEASTATLSDGWYYVDGRPTVTDRITVSGTANLILCDGASLNAISKGISVPSGATLNIYAQSNGYDMGTLDARTGEGNAAIGGDYGENSGTINIHGGNITAISGRSNTKYAGAGIGGGSMGGNCGSVTIYGGDVYAIGGGDTDSNYSKQSAGIGGGYGGNGGNVTIYGGKVAASALFKNDICASGIGKGEGGTSEGTITLGKLIALEGCDSGEYEPIADPNTTRKVYMRTAPVTYVLVPAKAATCTEDGNYEYYTKDGKYYTKSGDDYTETTLEAVTIPALGHDYKKTVIKEVTCTEDGEYEFKCSRCDSSYKTNPKAKGHKWNATYTWSEDYSTCTGDAVCKNDKSHTATETVTATSEVIKAATCTRPGSMTYTAVFTHEAFKTQTKTVEIPALGHDRDENGVCKRCGDTPSRGPSGGDSTTPTTSTTPVTSVTKEPEATITGDVVDGTTNELSWSVGGNVKEFDLYVEKDGKFLFLQTVSEDHADVICGINGKYYIEDGGKYNEYTYQDGKFVKTGTISADKIDSVKKKNNVTNDFMVKCKSDGKNVELKVSVKTYYKPAVKATAKKNGAYLKWAKVDGATKYRLSKLVNGKLKKVADVNGTSINLTGLKSGKTYTYAVKALVNNKWTTVWKSDLVTVTAK